MAGPILSGARRFKKTWASASDNFVADGNSLVFGYQSTNNAGRILDQLAAASTINGALAFSNQAVSGQSLQDMINTATDVDGAWVAGKKNYLFIWEFTNTIFNPIANNGGNTGLQAIELLRQYVAARRVAHQWDGIICLTGLPRVQVTFPRAGDTNDSLNAEMDIANAKLRSDYRALGIDVVADVRAAGGPFDTTRMPSITFAALDTIRYNGSTPWGASDGANIHIHLNNNGFAYVASVANAALKRMPG